MKICDSCGCRIFGSVKRAGSVKPAIDGADICSGCAALLDSEDLDNGPFCELKCVDLESLPPGEVLATPPREVLANLPIWDRFCSCGWRSQITSLKAANAALHEHALMHSRAGQICQIDEVNWEAVEREVRKFVAAGSGHAAQETEKSKIPKASPTRYPAALETLTFIPLAGLGALILILLILMVGAIANW